MQYNISFAFKAVIFKLMQQDKYVKHIHSIMRFFFINEETKPPKLFPIPKTFHKLVRKIVLELIVSMLFFFHFIIHNHTLGIKLPEGVVALKSLEDSGAHCFSV